MAILTVITVDRSGYNFTDNAVAAGASGDSFANDGQVGLYIFNGDGSSMTLSLAFSADAAVDGQTITARTVVVAAGKALVIGKFPSEWFTDSGTGRMSLTYSAVTSLKVLPFKFTTS